MDCASNSNYLSKTKEEPLSALRTLPPTPEQQIQTIYSQLSCQITTLQTNSIHNSNPQNRYYSLLIPCLPPLLAPNRMEGLSDLRHAYITLANTNMLQRDTAEKRYTNVGSALLWALDNAENAATYAGESAALWLVQALSTVVHVVARLCNQEWGLENGSDNAYQIVDTSTSQEPLPSRTDQVCRSKTVPNPQSIEEQRVKIKQDEVIQIPEGLKTSYSSLFASMPDYIHRGGKSITKRESIQHVRNGCLVPFSYVLKEYESDIDRALNRPKTAYVEMKYKDQKLFECIPLKYARLPYENMRRDFVAEKECSEETDFSSIEVDVSQYDRVIKLSMKAYTDNFPDATPNFLMGIPKQLFGVRTQIRTWVLKSCFVRVEDGEQFAEWPIRKALEMCQHDLYGIALLEVQFVDHVDGTLILISLIGIVIERDLLNYDDAVFELLDT